MFQAQILLTVSLQLEEAGKVSIMRKSGDILFAFLFQIFLFNVSSKKLNPIYAREILNYEIYLQIFYLYVWNIIFKCFALFKVALYLEYSN